MKIAVYVEGLSELIFVREFLKKWYEYDVSKIGFTCLELRGDKNILTDYQYGSSQSENYYSIVNVGNDSRALSKALENAKDHLEKSFDRVVVLRDMYSEEYRKKQPNRIIDQSIIKQFIEGANKAIEIKQFPGYVFCQFAIMEVEAWLLGMGWYLEKADNTLTQDFILQNAKYDLDCDPESSVFHPAKKVKDIYAKVGKNYDKHSHDINSIMSHLDKDDFLMLMELNKCKSFNHFIEKIVVIE